VRSWTAYDHRRRDPAFAAGWDEALRIGLFRIEADTIAARFEALAPIDYDTGKMLPPAQGVTCDLEFWRALALLREHKLARAGPGFARAGSRDAG